MRALRSSALAALLVAAAAGCWSRTAHAAERPDDAWVERVATAAERARAGDPAPLREAITAGLARESDPATREAARVLRSAWSADPDLDELAVADVLGTSRR